MGDVGQSQGVKGFRGAAKMMKHGVCCAMRRHVPLVVRVPAARSASDAPWTRSSPIAVSRPLASCRLRRPIPPPPHPPHPPAPLQPASGLPPRHPGQWPDPALLRQPGAPACTRLQAEQHDARIIMPHGAARADASASGAGCAAAGMAGYPSQRNASHGWVRGCADAWPALRGPVCACRCSTTT